MNEIVLLSYAIRVEAASKSTSGGASIAKRQPGDLHFTTELNRAVPTMLECIVTGKAAPMATLTVRGSASGNRSGFEYAKYTFTSLLFTSIDQGLTGAGRAVSTLSAVYRTVKVQQFASGSPVAMSCVE